MNKYANIQLRVMSGGVAGRAAIVYKKLLKCSLVKDKDANADNLRTFETLMNQVSPITGVEKSQYAVVREMARGHRDEFIKFIADSNQRHYVLMTDGPTITATLDISSLVTMKWSSSKSTYIITPYQLGDEIIELHTTRRTKRQTGLFSDVLDNIDDQPDESVIPKPRVLRERIFKQKNAKLNTVTDTNESDDADVASLAETNSETDAEFIEATESQTATEEAAEEEETVTEEAPDSVNEFIDTDSPDTDANSTNIMPKPSIKKAAKPANTGARSMAARGKPLKLNSVTKSNSVAKPSPTVIAAQAIAKTLNSANPSQVRTPSKPVSPAVSDTKQVFVRQTATGSTATKLASVKTASAKSSASKPGLTTKLAIAKPSASTAKATAAQAAAEIFGSLDDFAPTIAGASWADST